MSIAFIDFPHEHIRLHPLTLTRPACELRVGILKIREKWGHSFGESFGYYTEDYLSPKFSPPKEKTEFVINGRVLPDPELIEEIKKLEPNHGLTNKGVFVAARSATRKSLNSVTYSETKLPINTINRTWDIFLKNGEEIRKDFALLTSGRKSEKISDPHTIIYGSQIFIEHGLNIKASILNAEGGPIYIGKNVHISEGAVIQGPFAACEGAHISIGAHIRPNSTVGPFSRAGGEVSNAVIQGYSSKGHGGFLGNSVLGEWCNLGADTNNSNLKNTYNEVSMWDYESKVFIPSGLQFCGLIMGDHSKAAINTMFTTGTTVGVNANLHGAGFQKAFIPSFSWSTTDGYTTYTLDKALETAKLVMARRNMDLTQADQEILSYIFDARGLEGPNK